MPEFSWRGREWEFFTRLSPVYPVLARFTPVETFFSTALNRAVFHGRAFLRQCPDFSHLDSRTPYRRIIFYPTECDIIRRFLNRPRRLSFQTPTTIRRSARPEGLFFPILAWRKKFMRSQAVPSGLMRTVSGPTRTSDTLQTLELAHDPRLLKAPQKAPPSPGGEGWDEGERHSGSQPSTFSPGPTTRQYPAISGNTRTKVQFLAAYCHLSVRVLPRIHFSCRVCSRSFRPF
jgi:hypothetical protein